MVGNVVTGITKTSPSAIKWSIRRCAKAYKRTVANSVIESSTKGTIALFKPRIAVVNKIQSAVVTRADEWFVLSENQGVE
jgi:hypothetical protein